jgi:hypothetical protein
LVKVQAAMAAQLVALVKVVLVALAAQTVVTTPEVHMAAAQVKHQEMLDRAVLVRFGLFGLEHQELPALFHQQILGTCKWNFLSALKMVNLLSIQF